MEISGQGRDALSDASADGGGDCLMEPVISGLYASAPEPLPFAPATDVRAFLLQREQGNLLVYSVTDLK